MHAIAPAVVCIEIDHHLVVGVETAREISPHLAWENANESGPHVPDELTENDQWLGGQ